MQQDGYKLVYISSPDEKLFTAVNLLHGAVSSQDNDGF